MAQHKYPYSLDKKPCISPCFEPFESVLNPIDLQYITSDMPFCVVNPYVKNRQVHNFDNCAAASDPSDQKIYRDTMEYELPYFYLNPDYFLNYYYKISSFEETLEYLETHKSDPVLTNLRILNSALITWGKKLDYIDDRLIDFYKLIIKKLWIKYIYSNYKQYIQIQNNKIYFSDKIPNLESNSKKYRVEKINFLFDKIITNQLIYTVLTDYIYKHQEDWDQIQDHNTEIFYQLSDYIKDEIDAIINP